DFLTLSSSHFDREPTFGPHAQRELQPSPILECRFDAPPADPRKRPVGRALGTVGDVPAPGIRPDRIDRLPNDIKSPGRIYSSYHNWLGKMMIGVHHNLEAARRLYPRSEERRVGNECRTRRG